MHKLTEILLMPWSCMPLTIQALATLLSVSAALCRCRSSSGAGSGLSSSAKAGIAIGVVAAVALAGLGLAFGLGHRSRRARGWHKEALDDAFTPGAYGRTDTAIEMQRGIRYP